MQTRMIMDSLTALLIYSSLQTVMRFLHLFTGKLRKQNVLSLFLLEEGTHDHNTFNLLKTFTNGIIKMDSNQRNIQLEGFIRSSKIPIFYEVTEKDIIIKNGT
jgi:archaellum biogenesis ATPase FlaH